MADLGSTATANAVRGGSAGSYVITVHVRANGSSNVQNVIAAIDALVDFNASGLGTSAVASGGQFVDVTAGGVATLAVPSISRGYTDNYIFSIFQ